MHAMDTVREFALKVDLWRKLPCRNGESNCVGDVPVRRSANWATSPPPSNLACTLTLTCAPCGHSCEVYNGSTSTTSSLQDDNSTNGDWREVEVKPSSEGQGSRVHEVSVSVPDLSHDTRYEVIVRAHNLYGWSEKSDRFFFTTNSGKGFYLALSFSRMFKSFLTHNIE